MADFNKAYAITETHEGSYSDHPHDRGGETIFGISRVHHPTWPGWDIVDVLKDQGRLDTAESNEELQKQKLLFYRNEYWDKFRGTHISSQRIANVLFDIAVNMGWRVAGRLLQEALNVFNRNGELYDDISVDGWVGSETLAVLEAYLAVDNVDLLAGDIVVQMGARYHRIMKEDPTQETFARGWMKRVTVKFAGNE